MPLYTIGHSNHTPERLLEIIFPFGVTLIVDIRSVPYSGRFPHFNRDNLAEFLKSHGITYEWWGDCLGGIKDGERSFDSLAATDSFREAIEKLARDYAGADEGNDSVACLLCAERDPAKCHRSMLVGPALRSLPGGGVDLHHILPDGTLILQSELEERQSAPKVDRAGTLSLFDDLTNS